MLNPLTLFSTNDEVIDSVQLQGLNLIMALTGPSDAGHVVPQISAELLNNLDHTLVASFDADQLIHYRDRRPQISFLGDHFAAYQPPALDLYLMRDGLERPFLFLTGFEPDLQWERFSRAVRALVEALNVRLTSWVQSMPLPVPHTRPLGVTVSGNRRDLIEGISSWKPSAELPASVVQLLELRLSEAGHDVAGYVVHVPHYLAEAEYPAAAVAALEYLGAAAAVVLPTDRLREAGRRVEHDIAEQVNGSAEVQGVVKNLEKRYDEYAGTSVRKSLLVNDKDELPNADELGAALEEFLAGHERPGDD